MKNKSTKTDVHFHIVHNERTQLFYVVDERLNLAVGIYNTKKDALEGLLTKHAKAA